MHYKKTIQFLKLGLLTYGLIQLGAWAQSWRLLNAQDLSYLDVVVNASAKPEAALTFLQMVGVLAITGIGILLTIGVLYHLFTALRHIKHTIFTETVLKSFAKACRWGMGWILWNLIEPAFLSIALTIHNAPGSRMLTLGIGTQHLSQVLVLGFLYLFAKILEEGHLLHSEQKLVI